MLVALSVISIAALALLRLDAYAVRAAGDLDESTMAGIVAQNRAVELWTDPAPPTIGNSAIGVTNAGRDWRVEQRVARTADDALLRSEEHTSELQSLMRISYAVFCLKKKNTNLTV